MRLNLPAKNGDIIRTETDTNESFISKNIGVVCILYRIDSIIYKPASLLNLNEHIDNGDIWARCEDKIWSTILNKTETMYQ